ncbi:hypothetical protein WN943_022058 [Citrus x changshan-huyou]
MDFCGATLSKWRREVIPDDEESVRHYVIYVIGGFNISANWVFATCRGYAMEEREDKNAEKKEEIIVRRHCYCQLPFVACSPAAVAKRLRR